MKLAIGYVRVSTQGQAEEGASLEAQRAKIAQWCDVNDYELMTVYSDSGISGARMDTRDGLLQALTAARKGMALVCYSLSRLARSTRDMLDIADRLEVRGADMVSLTERIDTTSAAGRMVFRMLAVLSEFERDLISERTRTALNHKRNKGEVYSPVPFGFRAIEGRLERVSEEARVVAEILTQRHAGASYAEIANKLNARGMVGKRGGKWFPSTVRYIVQRQAA